MAVGWVILRGPDAEFDRNEPRSTRRAPQDDEREMSTGVTAAEAELRQ
jgi:hypothetical protein